MIKKLMQIALGVVVFTDCFCMNDKKILSKDERYGTGALHLSPHFHKNEGENVQKNDKANELNNKNTAILVSLTNDCEIFEYTCLNQMPTYLQSLVLGLLDGCKPELIRKDGVQNFNYEDLLEVLLFLNDQQHYGALKLLCGSIVQEYSEHFENYRENAIFLRRRGLRYCLHGLAEDLMIQFVGLRKSEVLKSFIDAELRLKVTPKDIGSYYQRVVIELCNNVCRYQSNYELRELEFMLKILHDMNINNDFRIPGSISTVLQWFSNTTDPKSYEKIKKLFLKMRKNNFLIYTPEQ